MNDCLVRAKDLLIKYKPVLDAIAMELIRVESIEREEYEKLLTLHGIKPKVKIGDEVYVAPQANPNAVPTVTHGHVESHVGLLKEKSEGEENDEIKPVRRQKRHDGT